MWTRLAQAALIPLLLAACGPSERERAAAFERQCLAAHFDPPQCRLLWQMAKATYNARAAADDATAGAAASLAVGAAGAVSK